MQDGKIIERFHSKQHYRTVFDQKTGFFVRKEDAGFPEPAYANDGPELIDLSITNFCERGCSFCYRETKRNEALFMDIADIENVVSQAHECGTLQIALGGGNPNQHPEFVEILRMIRSNDIVPSYTTNGDGLTDEVLDATANYCGAMALSVYPPYDEYIYNLSLARMIDYGITVNLHAIIREDTLGMWMRWLQTPPSFFKYVNAVIFLNYKPLRNVLPFDKNQAKTFFEAVNKCECVKIGFDSCSISGIAQWMKIPASLIEPCEAARFSAFISEDMKMYPCSFMVGNDLCGDLRNNSLLQIWQDNELFAQYREETILERCNGCKVYNKCRGGCHLYPDINFCNN